MKPIRIYLENFKIHEKTDIDCTKFDSALILAVCNNNENISNGGGKSTIAHAIEWALYGTLPIKGISKLVRDGCKKAIVIYEFEQDGTVYKIKRIKNKKPDTSDVEFYYKKDDEWESISGKTPTQTTEKILSVIKISNTSCRNTIIFSQKDIEGLPYLTPAKRKQLFKEQLDLLIYDLYKEEAKRRFQSIEMELKSTESQLEFINDTDLTLKEKEKNLKEIQKLIKSNNKKSKSLETSIQKSIDEIKCQESKIKDQFPEKIAQLDTLKQELLLKKEESKLISNKLNELNHGLSQTSKKINGNKVKFSDLKHRIDFLSKKINSWDSGRKTSEIESDLNNCTSNEEKLISYLSRQKAEIDKLSKKPSHQDVCDDCGQTVSEEQWSAFIGEREKQLTKVKSIYNQNIDRLKSQREKKTSLKEELSETKDKQYKLASLGAELSNAKKEESSLEELIVHLTEQKENIKNSLQEKNEKQEELVSTINNLQSKFNSLEKEINNTDLEDISNQINQLKESLQLRENEKTTVKDDTDSLVKESGSLEEGINQTNKNLKKKNELSNLKQVLKKQSLRAERVMESFGSHGVPSMIIHTILGELQLEANNLLSELRPGIEIFFSLTKERKKGQEEETLDIKYRVNSLEKDFDQLSGGQQVYISLSLKMATSYIIQKNLGVNLQFLILDEVDQPLDHYGKVALAEIIKKWQKNFKIFVITHNNFLKEKFSHHILIETQNDVARGRLVS